MKKIWIIIAGLSIAFAGCEENSAEQELDQFFEPHESEAWNAPFVRDETDLLMPDSYDKSGRAPSSSYTLNWSDDFNSTTLNSNIWNTTHKSFEPWPSGKWANWVKHWNKNAGDVRVNGRSVALKIQQSGTKSISTGRIDTKGKKKQKFGYFEARMHLPYPEGFQGAFWMMPDDNTGMQWQNANDNTCNDGCEIDIVEGNKTSNKYSINIHRDGYQDSPNNYHEANHFVVSAPGLRSNYYNIYGLQWEDWGLKFFYNGNVKKSVTWNNWIPRTDEYVILSSGVFFGTWAGSLNLSTLPDWTYVDWIKVYQQ